MMEAIGVCCTLLAGYSARNPATERTLFLILPLLVSISFFLISDIDSPRGGIIRVHPIDLVSLAHSIHAR
jgi:hypothetical protein